MKNMIAVVFLSALCASAHADVGAFIGLSYSFEANTGVGFTLQATSTRTENRAIVAAGVGYYPFAAKPAFALPVGVGYQGKDVGGIVNYDFLLQGFSVGAGYANTRNKSTPAPVPVSLGAPC
jgi:hypothetical protein